MKIYCWRRCGHCCAAAMAERPHSAAQRKMQFSIIKVSRQAVRLVLFDCLKLHVEMVNKNNSQKGVG